MRAIVVALFTLIAAPAGPAAPAPAAITWDAPLKSYPAKAGDTQAEFTFTARNPSDADVVVTAVSTSCRCTTASFPTMPCVIPAHGQAALKATLYFPGERRELTQTVFVETTTGNTSVTVKVLPPAVADPATKR